MNRLPNTEAVSRRAEPSFADVNERRESATRNASLLIELSQRSRQLDVLSRACRQVNSVLETPVILRTLVESARQMTDAATGFARLRESGRINFDEFRDAARR